MTRITLRDEADLTWYYCHGQQKFQRSVHGAMVERLERDSMGAHRCRTCGGSGIIETERALRAHEFKRKGIVTNTREVAARVDGIWTTERVTESRQVRLGDDCRICNGSGWVPMPRKRPRCDCWGMGKRARAECSRCLGTGRPTLDATPTCEVQEEGGVEVDGDTLKRFASVSRRLASIQETHRHTLERYYGPHGQSWASEPQGRLLGLQEFTPAGRRLIGKTKTEGDSATGASKSERIAAQWDLQRTQPQTWRQEMLDDANRQAQLCLAAAQNAFAAAEAGEWREFLESLWNHVDSTGDRYIAWIDRNWTDGIRLGVKDESDT